MEVVSFKGELSVENGDFDLHAERVVVRETEVAFNFNGVDEYGEFSIEGVAERKPSGTFESEDLPVTYPQYSDPSQAAIRFVRLEAIRQRCRVVGEWREANERWQFEGLLERFAM